MSATFYGADLWSRATAKPPTDPVASRNEGESPGTLLFRSFLISGLVIALLIVVVLVLVMIKQNRSDHLLRRNQQPRGRQSAGRPSHGHRVAPPIAQGRPQPAPESVPEGNPQQRLPAESAARSRPPSRPSPNAAPQGGWLGALVDDNRGEAMAHSHLDADGGYVAIGQCLVWASPHDVGEEWEAAHGARLRVRQVLERHQLSVVDGESVSWAPTTTERDRR